VALRIHRRIHLKVHLLDRGTMGWVMVIKLHREIQVIITVLRMRTVTPVMRQVNHRTLTRRMT